METQSDKFKAVLPNFSPAELAESLIVIQTTPAIDSKEKLEILFKVFEQPGLLEKVGYFFTQEHFLLFLNTLNKNPSYQKLLSSLLIGLRPAIFSESLHSMNDEQIELLKHESLLEPVHYHLTQFVHEGEKLHRDTELSSLSLEREFQSIKPEDLTSDKFNELVHRMDTSKDLLLNYLTRINKALSLVWQTDRIDLIEKLSVINESIHYQMTHTIGRIATEQAPSTGLYFIMEDLFSKIYDSSLKDSDAAVEGLTRLAIWYLKDYWELGLIPSVEDPTTLSPHYTGKNEEKNKEQHHHFFSHVQKQLDHLKIGTVGALKKAHIYSKPLLKTYIARHHYLLISR